LFGYRAVSAIFVAGLFKLSLPIPASFASPAYYLFQTFVSIFAIRMKKLFTLILMFIYATASTGVVLNVHYCMGKVSSVEVDNFNSNICKCKAPASEMTCCFSSVKVVKLHDAHKAGLATQKIEIPLFYLPSALSYIDISKTLPAVTPLPIANSPPLSEGTDIYIRNCVFRI
jgi:hypothetical protein